MLRKHLLATLFTVLAAACGGAPIEEITPAEELMTSEDALLATCNPRDATSCRRGESCLSVEGAGDFCTTGRCLDISDCGRGYTCRANHCLRIEPDRVDRCDPIYHPVARGSCRSVLGYYWDGRVCVGLSGCTVTDPDGLFRTLRECEATFAHCSGR
jgi:hypothetical protein